MTESLFSTYWYRVANLKPMLRDSVQIIRHVYRGQTWFVLHNNLNGRNHRFNAAAYRLIGRMDGGRTVQQLWEDAGKDSAEAVPTQDEVIRLLGRLQDADLIQSGILYGSRNRGRGQVYRIVPGNNRVSTGSGGASANRKLAGPSGVKDNRHKSG